MITLPSILIQFWVYTLTLPIVVQREIAIVIDEAIHKYNEKNPLESQIAKGLLQVAKRKNIGSIWRSNLEKPLAMSTPANGDTFSKVVIVFSIEF